MYFHHAKLHINHIYSVWENHNIKVFPTYSLTQIHRLTFFMWVKQSGLAKTILQGTVKGGRRWGRQRKRWEDNIREWTGLEFAKFQRAVENRGKWRKLVVKSSVVPQRHSWLRDRWDEMRIKDFLWISKSFLVQRVLQYKRYLYYVKSAILLGLLRSVFAYISEIWIPKVSI